MNIHLHICVKIISGLIILEEIAVLQKQNALPNGLQEFMLMELHALTGRILAGAYKQEYVQSTNLRMGHMPGAMYYPEGKNDCPLEIFYLY